MIIMGHIINFIIDNLWFFQFISLFISGILLFLIIYFFVKTDIIGEKIEHFFEVISGADISKRRTLKAWKEIQRKLKTKKENQLKIAVFEADQLLDEILKIVNYPGRGLEERLAQISPEQISNIEELRQAHKFKSRLVSEPDFVITPNEAGIIIEIYKKTFQELNLID